MYSERHTLENVFTARFYFSLIHGCIPVWIDTYNRNLKFNDLALPFKKSLHWNKLMVHVKYGHPILPRLERFHVDYEYVAASIAKIRYDEQATDFAIQELRDRL